MNSAPEGALFFVCLACRLGVCNNSQEVPVLDMDLEGGIPTLTGYCKDTAVLYGAFTTIKQLRKGALSCKRSVNFE
jgi:hypothetical protein